jgi:hypothetical protein
MYTYVCVHRGITCEDYGVLRCDTLYFLRERFEETGCILRLEDWGIRFL